jgi:hypothetical protein
VKATKKLCHLKDAPRLSANFCVSRRMAVRWAMPSFLVRLLGPLYLFRSFIVKWTVVTEWRTC